MKEMTSLERVRAVLNGELPDRVPVIPQGFMFCAANIGTKIGLINRDPKQMATLLKRALADTLRQFHGMKTKDLLAARHEKLLSYGKFKEIAVD